MNRTRRNWQRLVQETASTRGIISLNSTNGNALVLTSTGYGVFPDGSTIVIQNGSPSTIGINNGLNLQTNPWFSTDRFICRGLEPEASNPAISTLRNGDMWFNSTTSTTYLFNYSTIATSPWVLSTSIPNDTVANTTAETSLLAAPIAFQQGSFNNIGRQIRVTSAADFPQGTSTGGIFTLRCKLGSTVVWSTTSAALSGANGFYSQFFVTVTSSGSTGSTVGQGIAIFPSGTTVANQVINNSTDLIHASTLDYTAQWTLALAGNSIKLTLFDVEVLK